MSAHTVTQHRNPIILDPNSLYVATKPVMNEEFHWLLIHTDSCRTATCHQWTAIPRDRQNRETYIFSGLSNESDQILGFFKIGGYMSSPGVTLEEFKEICTEVFKYSGSTSRPGTLARLSSAEANRMKGIDGRLWVRRVLGRLRDLKYLDWGIDIDIDSDRLAKVEAKVLMRSRACDHLYHSSFLFGKRYEAVVEMV